MTEIDQGSCRNLLLQSMRAEDFDLLAPHFRPAMLDVGDLLAVRGKAIDTLCFPETGIITYSERTQDGNRVGIGHIGYEGFAGWPVLLGCGHSLNEARVTNDGGMAWRIDAGAFLDACQASEPLRLLMLSFVRMFAVQLSQTIVSSLTQPVETRLARWTLMAHDRVVEDEVRVTHEEIAVMLAVRRASVTDALHILEGDGLIRSLRGRVVICNRAGLRALAGDTYGYYETEYSRLIAPFPRHPS